MIHDVSTDADDPPQFIALRDVRSKCRNGVEYSGLRADEHHNRYPDIQPAHFQCPPARVFGTALAFADALDWHVAAAIESDGRIEATATTRLLRFKDDVVIRIRSNNGGTRLDIRSASRIGSSDFGANARRIRLFLDNLNSSLKTNT